MAARIRLLLAALAVSGAVPVSAASMLAVSSPGDRAVHFYVVGGGGAVIGLAATVPIAKPPGEMCLAPDSKFLFVSSAGDKSVSVVDTNTRKVVGTLTAPGMQSPDGCAVSRDSKKLYSVDSAAEAVFVFSIESKELLKKIPVGQSPRRAVFTPDGKSVLVSNSHSDTLSVIDSATDTVAKTIKTGNEPRDMIFSPDGKLLAVTLINDDCVALFKTDTLEFKQQVAAVRSPQHLEFSPDSQRLYVVGKVSDAVGVLRIGPLARLEDVIAVDHGPLGTMNFWGLAQSPDGRYLYLGNLGEGTISIIDLRLMKFTRAFPGSKTPTSLVLINPPGSVVGMSAAARLDHYRDLAQKAMDAAAKSDFAPARRLCMTLEQDWDEGESALRQKDPDTWNRVDQALDAFIQPILRSAAQPPNATTLAAAHQDFVASLKSVHPKSGSSRSRRGCKVVDNKRDERIEQARGASPCG